jgi:hypothetical protein
VARIVRDVTRVPPMGGDVTGCIRAIVEIEIIRERERVLRKTKLGILGKRSG